MHCIGARYANTSADYLSPTTDSYSDAAPTTKPKMNQSIHYCSTWIKLFSCVFVVIFCFIDVVKCRTLDTKVEKEKLTPWQPNYCNDTRLQNEADLEKTALGQFLGYKCDPVFYHCRWGIDGWRTYRKLCRKGLVYDTTGTQNCNYDFNVKGCGANIQCADCVAEQFACCLSEECIDSGQRCDGKYDCTLEEDEQNCPTCGANEFPCVNSEQCIPIENRCDSFQQCSDATDELHCDICGQGFYYCVNTQRCIEQELRCDGKKDCSLGEDEVFCRYQHQPNYICRDQQNSVAKEEVCDGKDDCPDGSDEKYCDETVPNYDIDQADEVVPMMGREMIGAVNGKYSQKLNTIDPSNSHKTDENDNLGSTTGTDEPPQFMHGLKLATTDTPIGHAGVMLKKANGKENEEEDYAGDEEYFYEEEQYQ